MWKNAPNGSGSAIVVTMVGVALSTPVAAGDTTPRQLFALGGRALDRRDGRMAAEYLLRSNQMNWNLQTVFNLAAAYECEYIWQDQEFAALQNAIERYQEYLGEAPEESPVRRIAGLRLVRLMEIRNRLAASEAPTQLMLLVEPAAARRVRVYVDDEPPGGLSAPALYDVKPGIKKVKVRAEASGFLARTQEEEVVEHHVRPVNIVLDPAPGTVRIQGGDGKAQVYIDGEVSPPIGAIAPGEHAITVVRRGRRPWSSTFNVRSAIETTVVVPALELSDKRKAAISTGVGAGALLLLGAVAGAAALGYDSSLSSPPMPVESPAGGAIPPRNEDRQAWDRRVDLRDGFSTATTALVGAALLAGVVAAFLVAVDTPELSAKPARQKADAGLPTALTLFNF